MSVKNKVRNGGYVGVENVRYDRVKTGVVGPNKACFIAPFTPAFYRPPHPDLTTTLQTEPVETKQTSLQLSEPANHFSGLVLRDYQRDTINQLSLVMDRGVNKIILQLPTGAGKTIIAVEIIRQALEDGKRVLFVAHRRELVFQCADKLETLGIDYGIIMAGQNKSLVPDVQVCSIQTLSARVKRGVVQPPPADILIFDECHHNVAKTHLDLIDCYPEAVLVGLTATPCRGDGRGLGGLYEDLIIGPSISELTDQNHLVPVQYYAPTKPDLEGIKIRRGDYAEDQLSERMNHPELVGDIVENWAKICQDRQTVVFSTGVKHSIHIRDRFLNAGIKAEHLDGTTPKDERDDILKRLASGETQVVSNCMVLTEGWDSPAVSCCVLARPTKSLGLYLQMAGRILRPFQDKTDAVIIDHSGAVHEHGFIDEPMPWSLDPDEKIAERKAKTKYKSKNPITCGECDFVYSKQPDCPKCGWVPERKGAYFNVVDADLQRISRDGVMGAGELSSEEQEYFYRELAWIQEERGYKKGWVQYKFKEKFDGWPPYRLELDPIEPSIETLAWIRKGAVRYANEQRSNTVA